MEQITVTDKKEETAATKPKTDKKKGQLREFFIQNKVIILLSTASILVSIGALVYLYLYVFIVPPTPAQIINHNAQYVEGGITASDKQINDLGTPTLPKTEVDPLNGTLYTKAEMAKMLKRRPVAVMINNHTEGRPQSGLNDADIVYESVVESGITRYMAIFWSHGPNKVGPIRSARQYYLEWLSPFDALLIHDGCAATSDPRTNACGNIHTYNIKDVSTRNSWRSTDRVAPHNEYNTVIGAWEYGVENKLDSFPSKTESWKFKRDAGFDQRGSKTRVKIQYRTDIPNGGAYDTEWVYNRTTNNYTHRIGGVTDIDLDTKKTITAKNVIIEEVELIDAFDGKGRVIITTIGTGKARMLIDGKIINGKWKKTSRTDRTRYYNNAGEEIQFNRGNVWINVVSKDRGKFAIIEQ